MTPKSESHIFIVWQSGFHQLSRILWELSLEFEINHARKITWNTQEIVQNLSRIYPNRTFTPESSKLKEIGGNQLVMILVTDKAPQITNGKNTRTLRYKTTHRTKERVHPIFRWRTKNINYLHASDLESDAFFNFHGLTGESREQFETLKQRPHTHYLPLESEHRLELTHRENQAFASPQEVFNALNTHVNYAVLRNFEGWPETLVSESHQDIDLLTDDYYKTLLILGAVPVFPQPYRVHHLVPVGDRTIPFDIRSVDDGYYDPTWARHLLNHRVMHLGFYRLSDTDYFWSLLYHGIYHKKTLSKEYHERLERIREPLSDEPKRMLDTYLKEHSYEVTTPLDQSVKLQKPPFAQGLFYLSACMRILHSLIKPPTTDLSHLREHDALKHVERHLARTRRIKHGVYVVENRIIKQTDANRTFLMDQEATMLERLREHEYFPHVIDRFDHEGQSYLVMDRRSGTPLNHHFNLTNKQLARLETDLHAIIEILSKNQITHRDLRPENLLMTPQGALSLVDFEFAKPFDTDIQAPSAVGRYILLNAQKNLGAGWYKKGIPDKEIDPTAAQKVLEYYQTNRSIKKWPRFLKAMLRERLKRLTSV